MNKLSFMLELQGNGIARIASLTKNKGEREEKKGGKNEKMVRKKRGYTNRTITVSAPQKDRLVRI